MKASIKKTKECYSILENYKGDNTYIKMLHYMTFVKKSKILNDFEIEYVLENINTKPVIINKMFKIAKSFGPELKEKLQSDFIPEFILITTLIGETSTHYHVDVIYRKSIPKPTRVFIPKKHILGDLKDTGYDDIIVNFSPFNEILAKEDKKLFEHQESGTKYLLKKRKCILADDQGLGKTTTAIVASIAGNFKKILIICPASVKSTWKREITRFIPENEIGIVNSDMWVEDKRYTIINYDILHMHHSIPKETITEDKVISKNGSEEIVSVNKKVKSRKKELIETAFQESNMLKANFDLIIIDECHKLSNNKSNRYEMIYDYIRKSKIKNIYLLSGTPMTNKPINLYHVLTLINHNVVENYDYFVKEYCNGKKINKNGRSMWLNGGSSNLDDLMLKIKTSYLRRLKKDIPGMVTKSIHLRYYDLTNEERLKYENLWNEYEEYQNSIGNYALNRDLVEGIFLRKFISNAMVKNTIEMTNEFLEDDNKVFIACSFDDEIEELKKYYGDLAVVYKGGMTTKQKDNAEHSFMNDKNVKVFIGNIIAAGVGLTLTSSHICIFNSYDWVPGNNEQMMDRIHRLGQKFEVEVYFQLFSNTISEHMWETIMSKKINIDKVIKEEKEKG